MVSIHDPAGDSQNATLSQAFEIVQRLRAPYSVKPSTEMMICVARAIHNPSGRLHLILRSGRNG
jgi:hypothetical protein